MKKKIPIQKFASLGCSLLLTLALILTNVSCSRSEAAQPAIQTGQQTIVDMSGRTVKLPKEIKKVYSTGQPGVVMLYTLCPEKLLGWCLPVSQQEGEYLNPKYLSLPVLGLMQGSNSTANREEIMARHPDMILLMTGMNEDAATTADEIQKTMGIPVVTADFSLKNIGETYRFLGKLLNENERAEVLADYCDKVYQSAEKTAAGIPEDEKVKVYYAQGGNGMQTAPSGSSHSEVLDLVGGINVVKLPADTDGRLTINLEQLMAYDPDIILFSYSMGHEGTDLYSDETTVALIAADSRWAMLRAVKNKMVFSTPCYPYNWVDMPPSANRILGIEWLGALLYPEYYKADIDQETKDFYQLFYQKELSEQQINQLLVHARRVEKE